MLRRLWHSQEAQDLIEYALMAAAVAVACAAVMTPVAPQISTICSRVVSALGQ